MVAWACHSRLDTPALHRGNASKAAVQKTPSVQPSAHRRAYTKVVLKRTSEILTFPEQMKAGSHKRRRTGPAVGLRERTGVDVVVEFLRAQTEQLDEDLCSVLA